MSLRYVVVSLLAATVTTSGAIGAPAAGNAPTGTSRPPAPEAAAARRDRLVASFVRNMRRNYADLGEAAGLTNAEQDSVLTLLATYQVKSMDAEMAHATDGIAGKLALDLLENQRRSELVRLLGEQRAACVLAFEETVPVRMETRLLASVLSETPWPLTSAQSRQFTDLAIRALSRQSAPAVRDGAENRDAVAQADLAQLDRVNTTLLEVARGILSAEQYACYAKFMDQRDVFRGDLVED
jgi:hypothetical protein